MVIKQIFKYVVIVAMLFVVVEVPAARKIVGKEAEALIVAPQSEALSLVANPNVGDADESAAVTLEDEELLNKDHVKDLKLQGTDLQLQEEDATQVNGDAALSDEDMLNSAEFEEFMNSPEAKQMIAQVEDLQKNNPEEFKKMMDEAEKMMLAMQSGEGFDFGDLPADNQVATAPAA